VGDAVELSSSPEGVRLRLRVKPGARRERLVGAHGGALKLEVTSPPERGKANRAVVALLARVLGVPRKDVAVVMGQTSQDKVVEVVGVDAAEVAKALHAAGVASSRTR